MHKPTLFFSHSSRDKEIIMSIKKKLDSATGGVMDIFMSSDGQSIPFGTNWIHKIEEGLQAAKIMFVFITENSISSGWIYFEAGFAYSKGIQVIPVGIGVDIGLLKAPLNMLQGFNISSEESLNNFITIANRTFDYKFPSAFTHNDYLEVIENLSTDSANASEFENIVRKIEFEIYGEETLVGGEKRQLDIDHFFNKIIAYLEGNHISFSKVEKYKSIDTTCLVTTGIKIVYRKEKEPSKTNLNPHENCAKISFHISRYNFIKTFALVTNLLKLLEDRENFYVRLHLREKYGCIISDEDSSSIVSQHVEFDVLKDSTNAYLWDDLGIRFYLFSTRKYNGGNKPDYFVSVAFSNNNMRPENIIRLLSKLYEIGLIFEV